MKRYYFRIEMYMTIQLHNAIQNYAEKKYYTALFLNKTSENW